MSLTFEGFRDDDHAYQLFRERYLDALYSDHDKGHPGRKSPVETCHYCQDNALPVDNSEGH